MKKPSQTFTEAICPACEGTGFPKVKQPGQPGRKIYPAACKRCFGKGRIKKVVGAGDQAIIRAG
jgi:DnaJ-class molecular chaperone